MSKIILTADSPCDLSKELIGRYNVKEICPLHITIGDKSYDDGVNIQPDEIYKNFENTGVLPKTSAVNTKEYIDVFKPYVEQGYTIIHINIGSALSSSYQNCCKAAEVLGNIYPIDSCSLSTGIGLIVIEAAERIAKGMEAEQIVKEVKALTSNCQASFVINKLDYLRAGGRCSTLTMLGANLLKIKPCIEVNNADGSMTVGKKYRGKFETVLAQYTKERLTMFDNIKKDRVFLTHAGVTKEQINIVYDILKDSKAFDEIIIARAGSTISSHCGRGTLGVIFMTE
ncbi:MAG: DegV family protein [Clostridia bacterium]|nr:DegV family protein [Clostridia bacterium]